MKTTNRILSVLLILAMLLSMLTCLTFAAQKNTGTRHELCTSLSSQANTYYSKNNFTYESYASLEGGNESCLESVNSDMFKALHDLMADTMTRSITYSALTDYWPDTDRENGTNEATLFYSDVTSGSYNREHVWPKSRASFHQTDGGCDIHHLRPTNNDVNSTRSNYTMGYVQDKYPNCSTKSYSGQTVLWYNERHVENNLSLGLVEINDNIKGDVARIFLYVYTRWEEPNLFENTPNPVIGPNDSKNNGYKVIESLETLLEWCENDPVDTWEMSRNDACESIQGNRNVFIDYPEFAWLLFGQEMPANMETPSGKAIETDPCDHTSSHDVRVEPTCTEKGSVTTLCDLCGKKLGKEKLPALGHNYVDGICSRCSAKESDLLANSFILTNSIQAGDEVIIVCAAKNIAFSTQKKFNYYQSYYNAGVNVSPANGMISNPPAEIIWTVGEKNGYYTFSANGQTIGMGTQHSSTDFGATYDTWALEEAVTEGATYIKNVGRNVYLEWFEDKDYWSGYHNKSNEALFAMNFYIKNTEEFPVETPTDPSDEPTEPSEEPTEPSEPPEEEDNKPIEYEGYDDVSKRDWFYDHVVFAVENGLMNGVGNDKFDPNGNVTRAMLVTILYRNEGEPDVEDLDNPFKDVKKNKWYTDAIIWAADNEIVNGMSATTFEPDTAITREQIATILYRYAEFNDIDVEEYEDTEISDFSDANSVSRYAKKAIRWAVGAEIINGMDGKLAPSKPATRAQLAAMLERYLNL